MTEQKDQGTDAQRVSIGNYLIDALDSPTVAAIARVFDPRYQRPNMSYSEQIASILEASFATRTPVPFGQMTDDMVDRALNAWFASPPSETDQGLERSMRAALEAAGSSGQMTAETRAILTELARHADRYAVAPDTADEYQIYVSLGLSRRADKELHSLAHPETSPRSPGATGQMNAADAVCWQVLHTDGKRWLHVHPVQLEDGSLAGRKLRPLFAHPPSPTATTVTPEAIEAALSLIRNQLAMTSDRTLLAHPSTERA